MICEVCHTEICEHDSLLSFVASTSRPPKRYHRGCWAMWVRLRNERDPVGPFADKDHDEA